MSSRNGAGLLQEIVTVADLATLLVMSERQIQRLTVQGILRRAKDKNGQLLRGRYVLGDAVSRYVEHLRDSLLADPSGEAYNQARARRMQAAADQAQLQLGRESGELIRRDDVIREIGPMLIVIKNHVLAIPSRLARAMLGLTEFAKSYQLLDDACRGALREASEFDVTKLGKVRDKNGANGANGPKRADRRKSR